MTLPFLLGLARLNRRRQPTGRSDHAWFCFSPYTTRDRGGTLRNRWWFGACPTDGQKVLSLAFANPTNCCPGCCGRWPAELGGNSNWWLGQPQRSASLLHMVLGVDVIPQQFAGRFDQGHHRRPIGFIEAAIHPIANGRGSPCWRPPQGNRQPLLPAAPDQGFPCWRGTGRHRRWRRRRPVPRRPSTPRRWWRCR